MDIFESGSLLMTQHGRDGPVMRLLPGGLAQVPIGTIVFPMKKHLVLKDSGKNKSRWVVLGNLDNFTGDTFAPKASKKVF